MVSPYCLLLWRDNKYWEGFRGFQVENDWVLKV
jgi:hypothetical protein